MLYPADAQVVARDPALGGLATLLDNESFARQLAIACPDHRIDSARAIYVRYKPATSCIVAYRVESGGQTIAVYARCQGVGHEAKARGSLRRRSHAGPLGQGLFLMPDINGSIHVFPNDHEIRALRVFTGEHQLQRVRRLVRSRPELWDGSIELVRYKPERRAVARIHAVGQQSASLRMYPASHFASARQRAWAVTSDGPLRVPEVLGESERYNAITHEWLDGTPFREAFSQTGMPSAELFANALAHMHRQRPSIGVMYTPSDYCTTVQAAADALPMLDGEAGAQAKSLVARLIEGVLDHPWRSQFIHGDLTTDQILFRTNEVALIDHDRVGYGDPLMDLGSFVASMVAHRLDGLGEGSTEGFAESFVREYSDATGVDCRAVGLFAACALVRMSAEPFRHRKESWPNRIRAFLDEAERMAPGAAIDA